MRARAHGLVALMLAGLMALGGCAAGPERRMSGDALMAAIDAGDAPVVIDVRSSAEYEAGHVPGALHFPFQSTWTRRDAFPVTPSEPVLLYCEHGPRAGLARFGLESLGYERVLSLEGHLSRWRADGRPLAAGTAPDGR